MPIPQVTNIVQDATIVLQQVGSWDEEYSPHQQLGYRTEELSLGSMSTIDDMASATSPKKKNQPLDQLAKVYPDPLVDWTIPPGTSITFDHQSLVGNLSMQRWYAQAGQDEPWCDFGQNSKQPSMQEAATSQTAKSSNTATQESVFLWSQGSRDCVTFPETKGKREKKGKKGEKGQ